MAVKNFVFREDCFGSEGASLKITFFPIFDSNWTQILAHKGANMEFLKHHFNIKSIRNTKKSILLPIMWL